MYPHTKAKLSRIYPSKRAKLKPFIPALMWAAVILTLSTGASVQPPQIGSWMEPDKLAHAAAYFLLASLVLWGLHRSNRLELRHIVLTVALSSGYGIALEIIQWAFFPGRFFEFWDIVANIIGSFGCVLVYFLLK